MENEWIEHDGGPCPVASGVNVQIELRSGHKNIGHAGRFDWRRGFGPFVCEGDNDIIAYRVVQS